MASNKIDRSYADAHYNGEIWKILMVEISVLAWTKFSGLEGAAIGCDLRSTYIGTLA